MNIKEKFVPELRFSTFDKKWDKSSIFNLANNDKERFNDGDWVESEFIINEGIRLIQTGNIGIGRLIQNTNKKYISEKSFIFLKCKEIFAGDILICRLADPAGRCCIFLPENEKSITSVDVSFFRPEETKTDMRFLVFIMSSSKWLHEVKKRSAGSTRSRISRSELGKIEIYLPQLIEQQKIADFLSTVDKKIEQLTRKKELLEQYKKGVMQKIFSQGIRFKQDDGSDFPDWALMKAKDVFINHSNKNHSGDLPILAASQEYGMVYRDSIDYKIQTSESSVKSYKIVEPGDFVISLRSFQGGIEYSNVRGICSPAYTVLKPKFPIVDLFFKFYFKKESFIERLSKTVIGIREGKQITYENFGGLKINVPEWEEQKIIADFLSIIQTKIDSIDNQITQTQTFKKGLLQQMFV